MQIDKGLRTGWKPMAIAVGLMAGTSVNLYADVDQYSKVYTVLNSSSTSRYLQEVDDTSDLSIELRRRFYNHYNSWYQQTKVLSSVQRIISHPDFQAIVTMGQAAVPYIVEELESRPSNLVWALNLIFKRKITQNPHATIEDASKLWVKELQKA